MTARSHVDNLKRSSSRLSELESLFRSPDTGETWSIGTALGEVTSQLHSALLDFDSLEVPDESSLIDDDLLSNENTKHIDDTCCKLRESIMLIIQSLYKMRDSDSENQTEDQQMDSDEGYVDSVDVINLSFSALMVLVGQREGIQSVKALP